MRRGSDRDGAPGGLPGEYAIGAPASRWTADAWTTVFGIETGACTLAPPDVSASATSVAP